MPSNMARIDNKVWLIKRAEKFLNGCYKNFKPEFQAVYLIMRTILGKAPNQLASNIDFAMVKAVAAVGQPE